MVHRQNTKDKCVEMFPKEVYEYIHVYMCICMFCVYINQTCCNRKITYHSFYNVIEDQKYYYSDPNYRAFD